MKSETLDNKEKKTGSATFCPEDGKLRLYIGRVPPEEYKRLRSEGWQTLHKQRDVGGGDFAAVWTPDREDTALGYADLVEDEDMSPEERAADRAERFSGYRARRAGDAVSQADRFDAGPTVHGYQSQERAERAATRHDRIADRALDAWSKAEYWTRRTEGVIGHALYVSSPEVRMGRIKRLESELRKVREGIEEHRKSYAAWRDVLAEEDADRAYRMACRLVDYGRYRAPFKHPRPEAAADKALSADGDSLNKLLHLEQGPITGHEAATLYLNHYVDPDSEAWQEKWRNTGTARWERHYELRLGYERQMLEAQGGRLASVEIEVGGYIGDKQIHRVNKSNATGRVVSVSVRVSKVSGYVYRVRNVQGADYALEQVLTERLTPGAYRPPTEADKEALQALLKKTKAAQPKVTKPTIINPTMAEALQLQAIWNEQNGHDQQGKPYEVLASTQEQFSANSKGAYARCGTVEIVQGGRRHRTVYGRNAPDFPVVAKVRCHYLRVVVLTNKPQKALPAATWDNPMAEALSNLEDSFDDLFEAVRKHADWRSQDKLSEDETELIRLAEVTGLYRDNSVTQRSFSEAGMRWVDEVLRRRSQEEPVAA